MKKAVFVGAGRPLAIQEQPMPVPREHQAVIRVARCGICSSDLRMTSGQGFDWPQGTALGHEYAGEVVEVGPGSRLRVGDRVTALPLSSCGQCPACVADAPLHCVQLRPMQGGYGQFTLIDERSALRLPESVSLADGALTEPLACGLHAVRKVPQLDGARVAVFGAGPMGLGAVFWARRLGAGTIATIARSRHAEDLVLSLGADRMITVGENFRERLSVALGGAPDVVIEAAGVPGILQQAIDIVRPRGTIVSIGGCMAPDPIVPMLGMAKELDLRFSVAYGRADFAGAIEALESGAIEPQVMVNETIGLNELPETFEALRQGRRATKVMVDPWRA